MEPEVTDGQARRLQSTMFSVLMEIRKERLRQEDLKAAGKFRFTCADKELTNHERLAILAEEFGEVARAICEGDLANMREELVQVAAVALSWVQGLDAEKAP